MPRRGQFADWIKRDDPPPSVRPPTLDAQYAAYLITEQKAGREALSFTRWLARKDHW